MQTPRTRSIRIAEGLALIAFAGLFARLALAHGRALLDEPLAALAGAFAGALIADLATGLVHWLCDRFGSESTPLVGRYLIAGFREHHRDPEAIGRHAFLERSGANVGATLPVLALAHPVAGALEGAAAAGATGAALAFALLVALTNEIHLQAHRATRCRAVAWLQRLGLVLRPEEHARHHRGGHDRAYCIATGWSNRVLDRLRLFDRLERRLRGGA
jgi:ubiquitin-conjugating enzyme E2 variant